MYVIKLYVQIDRNLFPFLYPLCKCNKQRDRDTQERRTGGLFQSFQPSITHFKYCCYFVHISPFFWSLWPWYITNDALTLQSRHFPNLMLWHRGCACYRKNLSVWFGLKSYFSSQREDCGEYRGYTASVSLPADRRCRVKKDPPIELSQSAFCFLFGLNLTTLQLHLYFYPSLSASQPLLGCIHWQRAGVRFSAQSQCC